MTDNAAQDLIDELTDLLSSEREALLQGHVSVVQRLAEQKETLVARLADMHQIPREALVPLHAKVTRNQALIESALEGIRAVADRIAEMRTVRATLQTYDRKGALQQITPDPARNVEKRA